MLRRVIPATAATALLLAGVTGCSAQQAAADCTPVMQSGALSDSIEVDGGYGEAVGIAIPENITIAASQRTVSDEAADRTTVASDQSLVGVNMAFFNASSGEPIYESLGFGTTTSPEFLLVDSAQANPLSEAVQCLSPGDRSVLALGPEESAQFAAQLTGTAEESVVGVIDVVSVSGLAVQGSVRGLPNGFPAVVTTEEGRPGIVLPPRDAPAGTTTAVRIKGEGDEITAENNVIAQVLEVTWDGAQVTNTWETGLTALGGEGDIAQSGYTYRTELTGQTVGSQVVIIENVEGATPRVLVIDLLSVN